MKNTKTKNSLN